ncbi:MAG: hypothetical protein A3A30_02380 [Candidatus Terrybacteria bacterium RIFCSPLOWO2_01_FULL_48_14]|nr:MAG: hypothetical protein A3A30_02380 [Candidatus Terrybacteria bacterium RIFCSPLOWO2_01_FULL_48_14]
MRAHRPLPPRIFTPPFFFLLIPPLPYLSNEERETIGQAMHEEESTSVAARPSLDDDAIDLQNP